jgi:cytoskeletal protein CcmA (bactofilin family)
MKDKYKITTFLGEGTEFEGILESSGAIRIDGHFRGEISGEVSLVVGEGAKIESDIHVSSLLNSGEIKGSVVAKERVEIREPGKVMGNIRTPSLVMDEGAIMEGHCRMHRTEEREGWEREEIDMREPNLVAISINKKFLSLELRIDDTDLIESVLHGLAKYVGKGSPVWVMRTFSESLGESRIEMISKTISNGEQMDEFIYDTERLISLFDKGPRPQPE